MDKSYIFTIGISLSALLIVLELVRRRHVSEEYSLLWLATALVMLALGLSRELLQNLAAQVNIYAPANLLFLMATVFLLFIQLHFSTVITRLTKENRRTAQQLALLRHELERLSGAEGLPGDSQGDEAE